MAMAGKVPPPQAFFMPVFPTHAFPTVLEPETGN